MFDRIISVGRSVQAAKRKPSISGLPPFFDATSNQSMIVDRPYQERTVVSWSRDAFRTWIAGQLR